jgi:hypothetical protein
MDKFSQLIIEAYRNQNFRFAEDPTPEPEIVAPPALDYSGLFTKMQSLEDAKKLSVYMNLKRAQTKLKLKYNIDSQLPIKLDSTKSPAQYSDNSNSNTDEKIQTYFYRVFEYLVNYFENEASSTPTTETTTETEESSSAVGTAPSSDSSSGETSATTETTSSGETTSTSAPGTEISQLSKLKIYITDLGFGTQYQILEKPTMFGNDTSKRRDDIQFYKVNDDTVGDSRCILQRLDGLSDWAVMKYGDGDVKHNNTAITSPIILAKDDKITMGENTQIVIVDTIVNSSSTPTSIQSESSGGFFGGGSSTPSSVGFGGGRRRRSF